jgi:hypothetical protein
MGKKSGSGSGMNHLEHISVSLNNNFWVKILKFFDADPGSGTRDGKNSDPESGMKKKSDKHPGSAIPSPMPGSRAF